MLSNKRLNEITKALNIPVNGNSSKFFCKDCGLLLANGYRRVVIGDRGPYIEFDEENMVKENMHYPEGQTHIYFNEFCSNCEHKIFIYNQKRTVAYADYMIDKWYIGPDLVKTENNTVCIDYSKKSELVVKSIF